MHSVSTPEPSQLRAAARRFRTALELGGLELASLADFPRGACGDASEMLGQYLADCNLGTWLYRSCASIPSHAWLERDGWIVDITADQFESVSQPVIVTTDRWWYEQRFPSAPGRRAADMTWFGDGSLVGVAAQADYDTLRARADRLSDITGVR